MLVSLSFLGEQLTIGRLANDLVMWCHPADVVSWPQVERLFHQSVFETMPLTRLDQNSVLQKAGTQGTLEPVQQQETPTIIPWDNPQSYAKQLLHKLNTKGLLFLFGEFSNCDVVIFGNIQMCVHLYYYTSSFISIIGPTFLTEDPGNTEVLFKSSHYCSLRHFRNKIKSMFSSQ